MTDTTPTMEEEMRSDAILTENEMPEKRSCNNGWNFLTLLALLLSIAALSISAWRAVQKNSPPRKTDLITQIKLLQASAAEQNKCIQTLQTAQQHTEDTFQQLTTQMATADNDRNEIVWEAKQFIVQANLALIAEKDVSAAIHLLERASQIVNQSNDARLLPIADAISQNLSTLKTLPHRNLDQTLSIWYPLRDSVANLAFRSGVWRKIAPSPETTQPELSDRANASRWQVIKTNALRVMQKMIVIRREQAITPPAIALADKRVITSELSLRLDAIAYALLRKDAPAYHLAIQQSEEWVRQWYDLKQPLVRTFLSTLRTLNEAMPDQPLPTLDNLLSTVSTALLQQSSHETSKEQRRIAG